MGHGWDTWPQAVPVVITCYNESKEPEVPQLGSSLIDRILSKPCYQYLILPALAKRWNLDDGNDESMVCSGYFDLQREEHGHLAVPLARGIYFLYYST